MSKQNLLRRFCALLAGVLCVTLLFGCQPAQPSIDPPAQKPGLYMILPGGKPADNPLATNALAVLKDFGTQKDLPVQTITAKNDTTKELTAAMTKAADQKAALVLCPGGVFEQAVFQLQSKYPNVKFVLIGGTPNDGGEAEKEALKTTTTTKTTTTVTTTLPTQTTTTQTAPTTWPGIITTAPLTARVEDAPLKRVYAQDKNTFCLTAQAGQGAFLAGYLTVLDGKRALGFVGGCDCDQERAALSGFYQGALAAAKALNLEPGAVSLRYGFWGSGLPGTKLEGVAKKWFQNGVQVIFCDGNSLTRPIANAAEELSGYLIGTGLDHAACTVRALTSVVYHGDTALMALLQAAFDEHAVGKTVTLTLAKDEITLAMDTALFATVNKTHLEKAEDALKDAVFDPLPPMPSFLEEGVALVTVRWAPLA